MVFKFVFPERYIILSWIPRSQTVSLKCVPLDTFVTFRESSGSEGLESATQRELKFITKTGN